MGLYGNSIINKDQEYINENRLIEEFDNQYCIEITEDMLLEDAARRARKKIFKKILKGCTNYVKSLGIKAKVNCTKNKSEFLNGDTNNLELRVYQSVFEFEEENKQLQKVGYTPENIKQYSKRRNMIDNFKPSDLEKYIRDNYNIEISSNKINKDLFFKISVKEENISEAAEEIFYEITKEDEEKNQRLVPIFILLSFKDYWVGKIIRKFTKSDYSHAAIAFEPTLSTIYNFNMDLKRYSGFGVESLKSYIDEGCTKLKVIAIMMPPEAKKKVKDTVYEYRKNKDQTSFAVRGLFRFIIGKHIDDKNAMKMFCSQFVAKVLNAHNINITGKDSEYTQPGDFGKYEEKNNFFVVYEGDIKKYTAAAVKKRLLELKTSTPYNKLITFKQENEDEEEEKEDKNNKKEDEKVEKESTDEYVSFKDFVIATEQLDHAIYSKKSLDEILTEVFKDEIE